MTAGSREPTPMRVTSDTTTPVDGQDISITNEPCASFAAPKRQGKYVKSIVPGERPTALFSTTTNLLRERSHGYDKNEGTDRDGRQHSPNNAALPGHVWNEPLDSTGVHQRPVSPQRQGPRRGLSPHSNRFQASPDFSAETRRAVRYDPEDSSHSRTRAAPPTRPDAPGSSFSPSASASLSREGVKNDTGVVQRRRHTLRFTRRLPGETWHELLLRQPEAEAAVQESVQNDVLELLRYGGEPYENLTVQDVQVNTTDPGILTVSFRVGYTVREKEEPQEEEGEETSREAPLNSTSASARRRHGHRSSRTMHRTDDGGHDEDEAMEVAMASERERRMTVEQDVEMRVRLCRFPLLESLRRRLARGESAGQGISPESSSSSSSTFSLNQQADVEAGFALPGYNSAFAAPGTPTTTPTASLVGGFDGGESVTSTVSRSSRRVTFSPSLDIRFLDHTRDVEADDYHWWEDEGWKRARAAAAQRAQTTSTSSSPSAFNVVGNSDTGGLPYYAMEAKDEMTNREPEGGEWHKHTESESRGSYRRPSLWETRTATGAPIAAVPPSEAAAAPPPPPSSSFSRSPTTSSSSSLRATPTRLQQGSQVIAESRKKSAISRRPIQREVETEEVGAMKSGGEDENAAWMPTAQREVPQPHPRPSLSGFTRPLLPSSPTSTHERRQGTDSPHVRRRVREREEEPREHHAIAPQRGERVRAHSQPPYPPTRVEKSEGVLYLDTHNANQDGEDNNGPRNDWEAEKKGTQRRPEYRLLSSEYHHRRRGRAASADAGDGIRPQWMGSSEFPASLSLVSPTTSTTSSAHPHSPRGVRLRREEDLAPARQRLTPPAAPPPTSTSPPPTTLRALEHVMPEKSSNARDTIALPTASSASSRGTPARSPLAATLTSSLGHAGAPPDRTRTVSAPRPATEGSERSSARKTMKEPPLSTRQATKPGQVPIPKERTAPAESKTETRNVAPVPTRGSTTTNTPPTTPASGKWVPPHPPPSGDTVSATDSPSAGKGLNPIVVKENGAHNKVRRPSSPVPPVMANTVGQETALTSPPVPQEAAGEQSSASRAEIIRVAATQEGNSGNRPISTAPTAAAASPPPKEEAMKPVNSSSRSSTGNVPHPEAKVPPPPPPSSETVLTMEVVKPAEDAARPSVSSKDKDMIPQATTTTTTMATTTVPSVSSSSSPSHPTSALHPALRSTSVLSLGPSMPQNSISRSISISESKPGRTNSAPHSSVSVASGHSTPPRLSPASVSRATGGAPSISAHHETLVSLVSAAAASSFLPDSSSGHVLPASDAMSSFVELMATPLAFSAEPSHQGGDLSLSRRSQSQLSRAPSPSSRASSVLRFSQDVPGSRASVSMMSAATGLAAPSDKDAATQDRMKEMLRTEMEWNMYTRLHHLKDLVQAAKEEQQQQQLGAAPKPETSGVWPMEEGRENEGVAEAEEEHNVRDKEEMSPPLPLFDERMSTTSSVLRDPTRDSVTTAAQRLFAGGRDASARTLTAHSIATPPGGVAEGASERSRISPTPSASFLHSYGHQPVAAKLATFRPQVHTGSSAAPPPPSSSSSRSGSMARHGSPASPSGSASGSAAGPQKRRNPVSGGGGLRGSPAAVQAASGAASGYTERADGNMWTPAASRRPSQAPSQVTTSPQNRPSSATPTTPPTSPAMSDEAAPPVLLSGTLRPGSIHLNVEQLQISREPEGGEADLALDSAEHRSTPTTSSPAVQHTVAIGTTVPSVTDTCTTTELSHPSPATGSHTTDDCVIGKEPLDGEEESKQKSPLSPTPTHTPTAAVAPTVVLPPPSPPKTKTSSPNLTRAAKSAGAKDRAPISRAISRTTRDTGSKKKMTAGGATPKTTAPAMVTSKKVLTAASVEVENNNNNRDSSHPLSTLKGGKHEIEEGTRSLPLGDIAAAAKLRAAMSAEKVGTPPSPIPTTTTTMK